MRMGKLEGVLVWATMVAMIQRLPVSEAFCNCLAPMGMFKSGKYGGLPQTASIYSPGLGTTVYGPQVAHPGERSSWYAQPQAQQVAPLAAFGYGSQYPTKRFNLFQPRWRAGSLFGGKKWMTDWRTIGMGNANFYRPAYMQPQGLPVAPGPLTGLQTLPPSGGYSYPQSSGGTANEYAANNYANSIQGPPRSSSPTTSAGSLGFSPQLSMNDGWTSVTPNQLPPLQYNSHLQQQLQQQQQLQLQQQQQQQQQLNNNLLNYGTDNYGAPDRLVQPAATSGPSSSVINSKNNKQQGQGTKGSGGGSSSKQSPYGTVKYSTAKK